MIVRSVMMSPFTLAAVALRLPKVLSRSNLDTQSWKINWELDFKGTTDDAVFSMIRQMYESGVIREKSFSRAQVLSIGLGAGLVNGYLHNEYPRKEHKNLNRMVSKSFIDHCSLSFDDRSKKPTKLSGQLKINITVVEVNAKAIQMARDWFGLKIDKSQHVILMDGADYVRDAAMEGRQFDIIFLDACSIQKKDDSICPIKGFQHHAVIQHLAKMAGKKGIVFVNVVSRSSTKKLKEVVSAKYDQHFKYRKQTKVEGTDNYILSYSQYKYQGLASSPAFKMKDI